MSSTERNRSKMRTRALFRTILRITLKKPEKLTVSSWAERYRILGENSHFKGKWSHDITP